MTILPSQVLLVGGEQGVVTYLSVCNWSQNSRSDRGPFLELIRNFEGNDQHIFHQSKILMSVTNTSSVTILLGKCCGTKRLPSEVNFWRYYESMSVLIYVCFPPSSKSSSMGQATCWVVWPPSWPSLPCKVCVSHGESLVG